CCSRTRAPSPETATLRINLAGVCWSPKPREPEYRCHNYSNARASEPPEEYGCVKHSMFGGSRKPTLKLGRFPGDQRATDNHVEYCERLYHPLIIAGWSMPVRAATAAMGRRRTRRELRRRQTAPCLQAFAL